MDPKWVRAESDELLVRVLLIAMSVLLVVLTWFTLSQGISTVFLQLYFLPIIIIAFRYGRKGIICSAVLSIIYLSLVVTYDWNNPAELFGGVFRFAVFIMIAVVVGLLLEVIKSREAEIQGIFACSESGVVVFSPADGRIERINPRFAKVLGYSVAEAQELLLAKIWQDPAERESMFSTLAAKGSARNIEAQFVQKDGTKIPCLVAASRLRDKRIALDVTDITDRKKNEELLKRQKEYTQLILDNARAAIMVVDPSTHRIEDVNRIAREKMGRTKEEVIGHVCHQFICPAAEGECPVTDLGQTCDNSEQILIRADGTQIPILKTVNSVQINGVQKLIESYVDISQLKAVRTALEKNRLELQRLNAELEDRVKVRTTELEDEIALRRDAEEKTTISLKEKELLLHEIHHRVKNNLQIIISLLRLQKQHVSDKQTVGMLNDSEGRIRSMALVHEKLYRSKDIAHIDLGDYLNTLAMNLISTYAMDQTRIRLKTELRGLSLDINRAIPVGLIMNELVSNAMKHGFPEGRRGEITITGRQERGVIHITLRDNGIGIPADFDWRHTKTLGLYLVTTLITQVKGTIDLEQENGTIWKITIPCENTPA